MLTRVRIALYWLVWFGSYVLPSTVCGQAASFRQLEQKVYAYNNVADYKKSQALLLPMLNSPAYTPDQRFQVAVLLSYTYKRVSDYPATLQFLETARQFAVKTSRPDSNLAQIQTQQALAYFDISEYGRSARLMQQLERHGFRYVDLENRAKLVHQQGYLLFRAKKYAEADATYDRAIIDLRASSPCDMPMILVKKMALYEAMNRRDRILPTFNQSNQYADSCGILKYRIYATDELLKLYSARHDAHLVAVTARTLDSLEFIYARSEHIAALHNQQEAFVKKNFDQQLQQDQQRESRLTLGLIAAVLIALLLLTGLLLYRRRQAQLGQALDQMRTELAQYAAQANAGEKGPGRRTLDQQRIDSLPAQQQKVLALLVKGLSNREIAGQMSVSENTVKYHIKNLYNELDVRTRRELLSRIGPKSD